MKKLILIESILATTILILMSFTSTVSAQSIESNNAGSSISQHINGKIINRLWKPGEIIYYLFIIVLIILYILTSGPAPF